MALPLESVPNFSEGRRVEQDLTIGPLEAKVAAGRVLLCVDRLLQHLAVEAEGAGLIRRQGAAELTADLLQLLGIELAELFGRNLGPADLGQRRLSETLEDIGNAPDTEADDQYAHHRGHDDLAEPV